MDEQKKGLFELLDRKQSFILGLVGGLLVLCTIGFFILLGITLTSEASACTNTASSFNAPKKFSECLDTGKTASVVSADQSLGVSLGIQGTPATFINGYLVSGNYPYEAVKGVVDALLAGKVPTWNTEQYGELTKTEMPEMPDAIWKGGDDTKVTIIEFSDFECPYCAKFTPTMDRILTEYGNKVKFTYRHFPLSFHANAQKAAEAFECAKEQGKAFEMYNKLFELSSQSKLNVDNFKKVANELKLK